MRIAIEEPMHGGGKGGVSAYTRHLLRALARLAPENEYLLFGYFFRRHAEKLATAARGQADGVRLMFPRWPESLVRRAEWGAGLPLIEGYLRLKGVDIYHAHRIPRRHWLKTVTTVHDLFPVVHPEWASPYLTDLWSEVLKPGMARADRIIAVSEQTKRDLMEFWSVPEERVEVIYEGVDRETFRPLEAPALAPLRDRYGLPARFLLMIGPFDPWSHPASALKALARLPKSCSEAGLVLAGSPGSLEGEVKRLVAELGLESRVRWTGYMPQEDLVGLYNLAEGLVFTSRYEGFGLPVLEAMACGTPVIASNASAVPEVAGDAALLVGPDDIEQIEESMRRVLEEAAVRASLRAKGLARAALFSWDRAAAGTLEVYRSVMGERGRQGGSQ